MISPEQWTDQYVAAWNQRDIEALLKLYSRDVEVRTPFARVYATEGAVKGRSELQSYLTESMKRMHGVTIEKTELYKGYLSLAFHCTDSKGRKSIITVIFNEREEAVFETTCLDRVR
jgi:hypothetical protein